jgi:phosphoribosylglycinamide formyltransferase-1
MTPIRLGILGSTNGTHLLNLIDAIKDHRLAATISVVLSNKADAKILTRAKKNKIPARFIDPTNLSREAFDQALSTELHKFPIDLMVLIGYMRILSPTFIAQWRDRIINIHPSLLPAFSGKMDRQVHQAVLDAGVFESGCTVHIVTELVDSGPIVTQKTCPVVAEDTVESLREKVQQLEGEALIEAIQTIQRGRHDTNPH